MQGFPRTRYQRELAPIAPSKSPLRFIVLVFALSVPFWLLGAATDLQLLPALPVSGLMFICPGLAALLLVYKAQGSAGVVHLLRRSFDYKRITSKGWYVPILLLVPAVMVASYGVMRLLGLPLPAPEFPILALLPLSLAFFVSGVGEELGWSGYATEPMQERWNALLASMLLGAIWTVWHLIPLLQANRSPDWIAGWSLSTVAARVLIVWLYNNTGRSVFAAALFHAMLNICWQLFPNNGSHYDPRVSGPIMALVAVVVALSWGPRTLAGGPSTIRSRV